jgi:hypothetical protein
MLLFAHAKMDILDLNKLVLHVKIIKSLIVLEYVFVIKIQPRII